MIIIKNDDAEDGGPEREATGQDGKVREEPPSRSVAEVVAELDPDKRADFAMRLGGALGVMLELGLAEKQQAFVNIVCSLPSEDAMWLVFKMSGLLRRLKGQSEIQALIVETVCDAPSWRAKKLVDETFRIFDKMHGWESEQ